MDYAYVYYIFLGLAFVWIMLYCIFNTKRRYYDYNEYQIEVHAGWYNHKIIINGEIADEIRHRNWGMAMLTAHRENLLVEVRISKGFLGNIINTRINGVVVLDRNGK